MNFSEFVEAVGEHVKAAGGKVVQRRESPPTGGASWWISFTRAGCAYRLRFESHGALLTLEREQGSFVPNSPATWRFLESRPARSVELEAALELVDELLLRFLPAAR